MNSYIELPSLDHLTLLAKKQGINSWNELTNYVKNLPYGRNQNRTDAGLVLIEGKGTCSSKHALLKRIADLNQIQNVQLVIGIYKMNQMNTPKIGNVLSNNSLIYIPEAHCYLKIDGKQIDFTSKTSDIRLIENDIVEELEIEPEQVGEFKVAYHKEFIKIWLKKSKLHFTFKEIWKIREKCIENLSK